MERQSRLINCWIEEGEIIGELRARRTGLLQAIEALLEEPVPKKIRLAVESTTNPAKLRLWFTTVLHAKSIGELFEVMKLAP